MNEWIRLDYLGNAKLRRLIVVTVIGRSHVFRIVNL